MICIVLFCWYVNMINQNYISH